MSGTGRFDVIVVGAGGAGLTVALVAGQAGANVLLVDAARDIGGATALSAELSTLPARASRRTLAWWTIPIRCGVTISRSTNIDSTPVWLTASARKPH